MQCGINNRKCRIKKLVGGMYYTLGNNMRITTFHNRVERLTRVKREVVGKEEGIQVN